MPPFKPKSPTPKGKLPDAKRGTTKSGPPMKNQKAGPLASKKGTGMGEGKPLNPYR